jgi:hypothetical protein
MRSSTPCNVCTQTVDVSDCCTVLHRWAPDMTLPAVVDTLAPASLKSY